MVRLPQSIQTHTIQTRALRWASRKSSRAYATGIALTLSLMMVGCATTAPEEVVEDPAVSPTPELSDPNKISEPPVATETPGKESPVEVQPNGSGASQKQPAASDEMVTVLVYTIDDQCDAFVEESVQVPSNQAMAEAVGKAMNSVDYNAFKLDGYQVNVNGSTAVVDMSLAPGSERQFVSLSSCEQRALFGSVEETLLNNPDWDVDSVKFTDGGKEIVL